MSRQTVCSPTRTSAQPAKKGKRENLTLHDWMTVYSFVDAHPSMLQTDMVNHFKSKADGALVFNQATLSQKLKNRTEMEEHTFLRHTDILTAKQSWIDTYFFNK